MSLANFDVSIFNTDSFARTFFITDGSGQIIPLVTGDEIVFTISTAAGGTIKKQVVITTFTDGEAILTLTDGDISAIGVGTYVYDVVYNPASGGESLHLIPDDANNGLPTFKISLGAYAG